MGKGSRRCQVILANATVLFPRNPLYHLGCYVSIVDIFHHHYTLDCTSNLCLCHARACHLMGQHAIVRHL
jgi:hypothetical protein